LGADVAGYKLYQGGSTGNYTNAIVVGKATSVTVSNLLVGATYLFAVTAYDSSGRESAYSNEISYTVPCPLNQPPTIALTSPADGAYYTVPATIPFAATVNPNGHTIRQVEYYNGSTLLGTTTVAPYNFSWNNVGLGEYDLIARVVYDSGSEAYSASTLVAVVPPPPTSELTFSASAGTITSPFAVAGDTLYQPVETGVTGGGRAVYDFQIANTGDYLVSAMVLAPHEGANSFYVNIDAEPTDPFMIWDIPVCTNLTSQNVSWRGNGDGTSPEYMPTVFSLSAGKHQLIIRGREANTRLGVITLVAVLPPPPTVALTSPADGAYYTVPATIRFSAAVNPNGHTIRQVEYYNGSTLLGTTTVAPYNLSWNNVGLGEYDLIARVVYDSGRVVDSVSTLVAVVPPPTSELTFSAGAGTITSPFAVAGGTLYQPLETGVANGGRAVYDFELANAGDYIVSAMVLAPDDGANSFYVNIDAEPTDPFMTWDIPICTNLTSQNVSWRGNGDWTSSEFMPKVFSLSAGKHQLIIRGREGNTRLGAITIAARPDIRITFVTSGKSSLSPLATAPKLQIQAVTGGPVILTGRGQSGQSYDVQCSQDLQTWSLIGTMTLDASGSGHFTDPAGAGRAKSFYRLQGQ